MTGYVFLVSEDAYVLGFRSRNTNTIVHETIGGANEELCSYFQKRERELGYALKMENVDVKTGMTEIVFEKYLGFLTRKITVTKKMVGN